MKSTLVWETWIKLYVCMYIGAISIYIGYFCTCIRNLSFSLLSRYILSPLCLQFSAVKNRRSNKRHCVGFKTSTYLDMSWTEFHFCFFSSSGKNAAIYYEACIRKRLRETYYLKPVFLWEEIVHFRILVFKFLNTDIHTASIRCYRYSYCFSS